MLAAPVSFEGRLEQYVGRLHRDYTGKKDVVVYDYIDSHIKVFENMYAKKQKAFIYTRWNKLRKANFEDYFKKGRKKYYLSNREIRLLRCLLMKHLG